MVCGELGGEAWSKLREYQSSSDGISVAPPKLWSDCEDSRSNGATPLPGVYLQSPRTYLCIHMPATMSAQETASDSAPAGPVEMGYTELPFPPVTKQHILNCSYHNWHPKSVQFRHPLLVSFSPR